MRRLPIPPPIRRRASLQSWGRGDQTVVVSAFQREAIGDDYREVTEQVVTTHAVSVGVQRIPKAVQQPGLRFACATAMTCSSFAVSR